MATSGSADFTLTRDKIIKRALKIVGAIEAGEEPSADEISDGADALNALVKAWQAEGGYLWKHQEAALFLVQAQIQYDFGGSTTDHHCLVSDLATTTLSADAASGASTFAITSATGFAVSDNLGILLDDNSIQWTTVSSLAGTTVTPAATLSGAASSGNKVYAYTAKLTRPLKVATVRRRSTADIETPVETMARQVYFNLPNKTSQSVVNQVYYQPDRAAGHLYVWQAPANGKDHLRFDALLPFEDFDSANDDADFPAEWIEPLAWNLAYRLCPEYGVGGQKWDRLKIEASEMKARLLTWDSEFEDVQFEPDPMWGR